MLTLKPAFVIALAFRSQDVFVLGFTELFQHLVKTVPGNLSKQYLKHAVVLMYKLYDF